MGGRFVTGLHVRLVAENPTRWALISPLIYDPARGRLVVVPVDFETDFASVPRWPVLYWLLGGTHTAAAVLHDWLYTPPYKVSRARADALLREAAGVGAAPVAGWRRALVWLGVRIGGGGKFQQGAPA